MQQCTATSFVCLSCNSPVVLRSLLSTCRHMSGLQEHPRMLARDLSPVCLEPANFCRRCPDGTFGFAAPPTSCGQENEAVSAVISSVWSRTEECRWRWLGRQVQFVLAGASQHRESASGPKLLRTGAAPRLCSGSRSGGTTCLRSCFRLHPVATKRASLTRLASAAGHRGRGGLSNSS